MKKTFAIFKRFSVAQIAASVAVLAMLAFLASVKVNIKITPRDLAFGQAASYPVLPFSVGSAVNGKQSVFPSSYTIDTQTGTASASLSTSAAYDVTLPRDYARMVAVSFNVTTVPTTSPSMTPIVQQTDDGGITWYKVFAQDGTTFAAITTTGAVAAKDFPVYGDAMRVSYSAAAGTGGSLWTFTTKTNQAQ